MGWTNELYDVYEQALDIKPKGNEKPILPVSHSTQNAQIELTITESGEFVSARKVEKSEAETIIPVTEDSCSRGNGINPMPFADKLVYIAGDYSLYADGKHEDNSKHFEAYISQLGKWAEGEYSHKAVKSVYAYLIRSELMQDLIKSNVLILDENSGKLKENEKIAGIPQEDSFVRFRVNYVMFEDNCSETWKDKSLYDSFIKFNSQNAGELQLCYATGKENPVTYKHPSKIRNSGDKAKLISANDDTGFTYRGRFKDKEEAFSVSYEFSQKFHNALKWLIDRQGISIGSLTLIVWASGAKKVLDPTKSVCELEQNEDDEDDDDLPVQYNSMKQFEECMKKFIFGCKEEMQCNTKVMIMGLDAATTGRLSISVYSEIEASKYIDNIAKWHKETKWLHLRGKKSYYNSFSAKTIVECAFGTEQGNFIKCKEEVLKKTILRLISCITEGRNLPVDIMNALFIKASNPLSYKKNNFQKVIETACGMIQKYYIDQNDKRGMIYMGYDPKITDRSYLFGCLLAIADKAENDTYSETERNVRVTNAQRYWNVFSQRPAHSWQIIEERLKPYFNRLGKFQVKYTKWINEITDKLSVEDFNDKKLEPLYLEPTPKS